MCLSEAMVKFSYEPRALAVLATHQEAAQGPARCVKVLLEVLLPGDQVHHVPSLLTDTHSVDNLGDVAPGVAHFLDQVAMLFWTIQVIMGRSKSDVEHIHEVVGDRLWNHWSCDLWLDWLLCDWGFW
jgi:hypothetical protein